MTPQQRQSHISPKALLAEDDSQLRELVAGYLLQLGYQVQEAPNGAVAIEHLNDDPFDLLVTDLLMPQANGDSSIQHARKSGACNRFLLMSGNPYDPRFHSYSDSNDSCFIEKPFTFGDFEAKLHRLEGNELD